MDLKDAHMCYILQSSITKRLYVGYTTNFHRRLRQHNGEIVGGAKKTQKGRPWIPVCVLYGFHDNSASLRFEYRLQRHKIRKLRTETKVQQIVRAMSHLIESGDGSIVKDNKIAWPALTIYWFPGFHDNHIDHMMVSNQYID